jgi:hypothetical protein
VHILGLYPELEHLDVDVGVIRFRWSNMDPMELYSLAAICVITNPSTIFEIGTFDGATTAVLASAAPGARILTLDLPEDEGELHLRAGQTGEQSPGVGFRYRGAPGAERITQLYGDSRVFDFSSWYRQVDLVVVDGGHDYETVASDTATALGLVAAGGVVVWDDYCPIWPDVVRAVDEATMARQLDVVRIAGTELALHRSK